MSDLPLSTRIGPLLRRNPAEPARWAKDLAAMDRLAREAAATALSTGPSALGAATLAEALRDAARPDQAELAGGAATLATLFGPAPVTMELHLRPGVRFQAAPYDEGWFTGAGLFGAKQDGTMMILGGDGFSASGFGFHVSVEQDALVSFTPVGDCTGSWSALEPAPGLRSTAGAGAVVYDGAAALVTRQPVLWDVGSPGRFTAQGFAQPFGSIATPPAPMSFGPAPLAPVLAALRAKRRYLVWFYLWHVGVGMAGKAFIATLTARVPLVSVSTGPVPVVK